MQASTTRLRRLPEGEELETSEVEVDQAEQQRASNEAQKRVITTALQLALRTLSQKTLIALASLYSLLLAGAVYSLFWHISADPSVLQLVGAGGFALFVIVLHLVRKR